MSTRLTMSQPPRDAREVLQERLAEIMAKLADGETEPAALPALEIEERKLRRSPSACFQSAAARS